MERLVSEIIKNSTGPQNDKVKAAFDKVAEVKDKMKDNLVRILENQEEVKNMEKGSENIVQSAFEIRGNAKALERLA